MKISGLKDTIDWYNQNATQYSNATKDFIGYEQVEEFAMQITESGTILDAGCGSGRDTNILTKRGFNVIGIDLSDGLINEARRNFPNNTFLVGNFLDLPFNNNSFDGIWAHASLVHLETVADVQQALSEFNRVLKINGVLHVLVKAQTGKEKTAVVADTLSKHERFFQYFTISEMKSLLSDNNFEIIKSEQYNEADKSTLGRPEVEWILVLCRKNI